MTAQTQTAKQESLVVSTARELGMSESYLQLVKDVYAKNATDEELALFLRTSKRLGLDPTARQIYLVKRWDSSLKREVATPQTSIDGFRLIADRTERYVPGREATFQYAEDQTLVSATAYIKKFAGGEWHEISATAFYSEYVQKTKEGKPNSMWQKMPHLMLAKCAEALVLRKAFPAELSGIYTSEEMGTDPNAYAGGSSNGNSKSDYIDTTATTVETRHDAKADDPKDDAPTALEKRVAATCEELNAQGDSISWSFKSLIGYTRGLFRDENIKSFADLTEEQQTFLAEDLEERLKQLKNNS